MVATTATITPFDAKDVNDQVNKTVSQDGLLMRMAKAKGEQYAAGRGLANSSIGAEAAQRAVVDAALPIAQQNASQSFTAGQNALDRSQQLTMLDKQQTWQGGQSALDRQQQLTMQGNDFNNQSKLTTQQAQLQERRDQLLYQQQLGTLDKQSQIELQQLEAQLKNQLTLNNNQNSWNSGEAQKDRAQQLTVLEKQFGQETAQMAQQVVANTHGMYMGAIDSAVNSYNERYAALIADQNITGADKTNLVNNMRTELNSTLGMYQQMYSNISTIRPDWNSFPTIQLPGAQLVSEK